MEQPETPELAAITGGHMPPPDAATLTTLVIGIAKLLESEPSRARDLALARTMQIATRIFGPENGMAVFYTAMSILDLSDNSDLQILKSDTADEMLKTLLEAAELELKEVYEKRNNDPRHQALDRFLVAAEEAVGTSNPTEIAAYDNFVAAEGEPA